MTANPKPAGVMDMQGSREPITPAADRTLPKLQST